MEWGQYKQMSLLPLQLLLWGCSCPEVFWNSWPTVLILPCSLVSTGDASPKLLWDTLAQKCLCHWELGLLQPVGLPENPTWSDMLCAATPELRGNGTLWENCRCLQLCALDHELKGCWVQKFSNFKLWEYLVCGSQAALYRARGFNIWVGQTSNLHFRHLEGHSIFPQIN